MSKIIIISISLFALLSASFLQKSSYLSHEIFIENKRNAYDVIANDKSYGSGIAFFLTFKTPFIANRIQTGEYNIQEGETALSLILRILRGDFLSRKITFPEGFTVKMIVERLNNDPHLSGNIENIPEEGSLFPSTYIYKRNDSRSSIIRKMKHEMNNVILNVFQSKYNNNFIRKTITLASIIERETAVASEMPIIASVFYNRLKKKMRLQSDPTVIYAVSNGYGKLDHPLTKSELKFQSPYNTYRSGGVPPFPICCPSKNAIVAALNPANTDFLYFVANGDGTSHVFAKEYKSHVNSVNKRKSILASKK